MVTDICISVLDYFCNGMLLLLLLSRFSRVRLYATPQTAAHQAPPSLGFSRQEHWSGLPFPSPGDLPDPGSIGTSGQQLLLKPLRGILINFRSQIIVSASREERLSSSIVLLLAIWDPERSCIRPVSIFPQRYCPMTTIPQRCGSSSS